MNHRRASTGGVSNMMVVSVANNTNNNNHSSTQQTSFVVMQQDDTTMVQYPSSPEKSSGYQEEGDSDENRQETVTIITYNAKNRTTRRASFSGPITRRRSTAGGSTHHHHDPQSFPKPVRTVSSSSHINPQYVSNNTSTNESRTSVVTIQTSRGINPDIVARMSISKSGNGSVSGGVAAGNGLVHLVDDDDDDYMASPEQNRRGYMASNNQGNTMDMLYGLGAPQVSTNAPVGHHHLTKQSSQSSRRMARRGSNASSVQSRSSRASRRRASMDRRTFKSKDPLAAVSVYNGNNNKSADFSTMAYDTDDQLDHEDDSSGEDADGAGTTNVVDTFGYESDAASEHSRSESLSSSKRLRRNSCIIRRDHDALNTGGSVAFAGGSVMAMHNRSRSGMDIEFDIDDEEEDDPDSLFNRAKRRSQSMDLTPPPPPNLEAVRSSTPKGTERVIKTTAKRNTKEYAETFPDTRNVNDVPDMPPNVTIPSQPSTTFMSNDGSLKSPQPATNVESFRKSPLTVSYEPPTEANLRANLQHMLRIDKFSGNNPIALSPVKSPKRNMAHNRPVDADDSGGWGDVTMAVVGGGDLTTSRNDDIDDESSYGENMYTDTMGYSDDVDIYEQKARRRASMDNTHYDIDTVFQMKGIKVPNFKPVDGCRNASDFIVRSFTARMRISGFTVLKHNRSRWSKAKNRIIYLLPDNQTLSWRPSEEEAKAGSKNENKAVPKNDKDVDDGNINLNSSYSKGPKVDLSKCIEVRYACSVDPKNPKKRGTPVLRARCKDELAGKSFSLIFPNRTLDLTAFSNDQCRILMEGFSALCFRLQLQKMESNKMSDSDTDTKSKMHMNSSDDRCSNIDDDWASTKFGGSNTGTSQSYPVGPSPWGR